MTFKEIIDSFRAATFSEHEKGSRFERLVRSWLLSDPRYNNLERVWLWEEFPGRGDFGGKDTGIDLVAKTESGEYWAIQCKCYQEKAVISKGDVDSFLATSSRTFFDPATLRTVSFSNRLWISTTNHWGANAEEAIHNQQPPVNRIGLFDLETSSVDWDKLLAGIEGTKAQLPGKQPREHQLRAISAAYGHFTANDRGKLIMACGTGKTYTALKIAETMLPGAGLVLFLVPSISLLGQTLNSWHSDASKPIKAVCICSDSKASRRMRKRADDADDSTVDLAVPASTNPKNIARQLRQYRNHDGLTVVFSTYQSIEAVHEAQAEIMAETSGQYGVFDLAVCDEAHRTTGVKLSSQDESSFTKIHDDSFIRVRKRLYMTATPRLYGSAAKAKASEKDALLCSMDDEALYGKEFFRVGFSYAVEHGLLTDYKVLVLTVNEDDLPGSVLADIKDSNRKELNFDDTSKLIGVINGLSKVIRGDNRVTWDADPVLMRRAIAFCSAIGDRYTPGTSVNTAEVLPMVCEKYLSCLDDRQRSHVVRIAARHIDGSMNSQLRNEQLKWLADDNLRENECRVLTNVRCLSEGIDVPALDAVLFLSSRNSQIDVVQSVGRVMRNFRKGEAGEKKFGYIIIPVVVPADIKPEDALNNSDCFSVVWNILNALRSHDDGFNATVNKISLNRNKTAKVIVGAPGIGRNALSDRQDQRDAKLLADDEVARQLELRFAEMQCGIYAKLVEKCGDRLYWENWSRRVGLIARKFIERIARLVTEQPHVKSEFGVFVRGLRENLNPSVDEGQAVEMLAQHLISQPVFDALFADYNFVNNNAVSRSMHKMIVLLEKEGGFKKDTAELESFYDSVRVNVGCIDNLEGKQTIIKNLYEKFFKGAFPLTVEKLGIVYTPVECVDFIIRSVDDILRSEFNCSLTDENVHILDPFTGTGTFITRLLQSGLIRPEDMERKYLNEIHCNELVLLAYYIADVNIEAVYHDIMRPDRYVNYDGICLTDTFQLTETAQQNLSQEFFRENSEGVLRQKRSPIRVIIGNPPYSVGQKASNNNAANLAYPKLDARIAQTYANGSSASSVKALYDSYVKAFRWASDRIAENSDGGVVAFISNGSWLDSNGFDAFRRCLVHEFSDIYVLNLRGNQRTSGELSRKEGGKIFGQGSRTPISITFLVKNPAKAGKEATIHYHDIGDYLNREQKLSLVKGFRSVAGSSLDWQIITPTPRHDWINQRDGLFETMLPLAPEKKFDAATHSAFTLNSLGAASGRDPWSYNSSADVVEQTARESIDLFNETREAISQGRMTKPDFTSTKLSWSRAVRDDLERCKIYDFTEAEIRPALYRPFFRQNLLWYRPLVEMRYRVAHLFPCREAKNRLICVSGIGVTKDFSCIVTDQLPDLELIGKSQCFPLYWYDEKPEVLQGALPFDDAAQDTSRQKYRRHDGISDWILQEMRERFGASEEITKEQIFHYVYGILHSPQYRERFAADLKKSLPRIPIVAAVHDFRAFSTAGERLAQLHLGYEQVAPHPDVTVQIDDAAFASGCSEYDRFRVEKMVFPKVRNDAGKLIQDKSRIVYNANIVIHNIPARAYEYVVNGKPAVEWIMERYAVTVDRKSQIKNDPNDWGREHGKPRYILDLLLSVINVSTQTVDIIDTLPALEF